MKQSPYFNINYGWPRGTDGWDTGMNANLLVLSFLDTQRVISIVPSVPDDPTDGDAYVVSSDSSARFYADGVWNIVYPADGWEFTTAIDNATWVYESGVPVQRVNPNDLSSAVNQLDIRVTDAEDQIGGLTDSVENLVDLPDRVVELEENSATDAELQDVVLEVESLDQRTGELENYNTSLDQTLIAINSNIQTNVDALESKLDSIVPGDGVLVDDTDPTNPLVSVDISFFSPVVATGSYNDLIDLPTLGTAASEDVASFDPAGAAEDVNTTLTTLINERMSEAARDAVDSLDPTTATLEDLITALQLT